MKLELNPSDKDVRSVDANKEIDRISFDFKYVKHHAKLDDLGALRYFVKAGQLVEILDIPDSSRSVRLKP
jgi:hypothetical protein